MPEGVSFEHILVLATSVACGHCANTARANQELCSVQAQRIIDPFWDILDMSRFPGFVLPCHEY